MPTYELFGRLLILLPFYPLVLLGNIFGPLIDRLLPVVSLPVHYVFVFRK